MHEIASPPPLVQIVFIVAYATFFACLGLLRAMIDSCRRNYRETRAHSIRELAIQSGVPASSQEPLVNLLTEFLDCYFSPKKLLLLQFVYFLVTVLGCAAVVFSIWGLYLESRSLYSPVQTSLSAHANESSRIKAEMQNSVSGTRASAFLRQKIEKLAADNEQNNDLLRMATVSTFKSAALVAYIIVFLASSFFLSLTVAATWLTEFFPELVKIVFV